MSLHQIVLREIHLKRSVYLEKLLNNKKTEKNVGVELRRTRSSKLSHSEPSLIFFRVFDKTRSRTGLDLC